MCEVEAEIEASLMGHKKKKAAEESPLDEGEIQLKQALKEALCTNDGNSTNGSSGS